MTGAAPSVISRGALDSSERGPAAPKPVAAGAAPTFTPVPIPAASNPLAATGQFVSGSRVPTANGVQSIPAQRVATKRAAKGGGIVSLESGGHILPAFDVATYGNGSTDAGQKVLRKMGGRPIKGKGDGVSDSIKAQIDGQHEARVANGEVYFPPKAVAKLGGKAKLDAMMKAAQTARMRTRSGEKVRL
jgi:hypothetical protein